MRSGVAAFAALCIVGALVGPFAAQAAHAASTFVVNTTSDHAPDGGVVAPGDCTLLEAITAANSATGSTIQFSIGGGGLQTIQPTSDLPTLNVTTTIDATTQPGYTGTPLIELDGTLVTTGNKIGLWVFGANSMIEGLVINRFGVWDLLIDASGNTIRANYIGTNAGGTAKSGSPNFGAFGVRGADNVVGGTSASDRNVIVGGLTISNNGAHGNVVQGNYIGTNAAGTADINDNYNLFITAGASNNTIGGTAAGAGNVISGSSSNGMQIDLNDSGNIVQGNYIGTNAAGNGAVGNNGAGILLYGSNNTIGGTTAGAGNVLSGNAEGIRVQGVGNTIQGNRVGVGPNGEVLGNTGVGVNVPSSEGHDNTIGGTAAGAANTIANNALAGVAVSTGVGNALEGNSIFDNGALGIDLDQNGLTPNDAGDGDNGGNHRQNFPVITGAAASGTGTHVSGTLDSAAGTYRVEVFSNPTCDASGYGEARTVLGAATGVAPGSFVTDVATTTVGSFATATATNEATGDTSELSQCFAVTAAVSDPPSWTVNTSADHDDGACTVADCTLREAINRANVDAATDTIAFSIPGAGVHTIQPTTDLPHLTQPVVVDATTQPGYSGAPLVELDGSLDTGADKIGLWIITNNSTIAGLAINRFVNRGILVNESASGNTIRANYVGTTADGTAASGNFAFQAVEVRGANNVVGGLSAADRNVIVDGVYVNYFGLGGASDNVVEGNFIGTNAAGTAALGGIGMQVGKATNTTIGGTDPGATNLISGNAGNGIEVNSNAVGTVIRRNLVGTNIFGTAAVPNTSAGMQIYGPGTVIGGAAIGVGNYVSGNSGDGIRLQTDHAVVQGNQIGVAVGGGALGNGGAGVSMIGLESHDNTVGGTTEGAGNTIANNGSDGVSVINGAGHTIEGNSISGNTGLGIDINNDGVTPNDAGDGDNGQNNRQNFPVITSATAGAPGSIAGTLDTTAGSFRVEVFKNVTCDASAHGEGATYLGSVATSDGTFNLAAAVDAGDIVTATATAPDGSTSEFSGCFTVTEPPVDGPSWTVNTTRAPVPSGPRPGLLSTATFGYPRLAYAS